MKLQVTAMLTAAGAAVIVATGMGALTHGKAIAAEPDSLPSAQVTVVRASNACFSAAINVTGFLVARKEAVVSLAPGYKVDEVLAGQGDRVTEDETLVRLERLSGPGQAAPPGRAGAAKSGPTKLKSPADGVITRSTAVVGATASPLQREPLFTIAVDGEIELEAEIPSIHTPALATGQRARVYTDDGRELSGRVRQVPAAINQKTQLGRARISLQPNSGLRVGMFARATVSADRSCGISVPSSAVTYRTGGTSVQVVRDNVIETRKVMVGFHSDTDTEIRRGLREGDMVVANAGSSLRDGDKVTPVLAGGERTEAR
jgi:HlyD family secretion protein